MSKNYDNWERLVAAVLLREKMRQTFPLPGKVNWDNDHEAPSPSRPPKFVQDRKTGATSYIVGARELRILMGDKSDYMEWTHDAGSSSTEVVEFKSIRRLDIRAKMETRMLTPETTYAAYLIFKLADIFEGLESAKAMIRFVDYEPEGDAEKRADIVHLQPVENRTGNKTPIRRADGWMEVQIGNFYVDKGVVGAVEARLLAAEHFKTGLIVKGIQFLPTYMHATQQNPIGRSVKTRKGKGKGVFSIFRILR